MGQTPIDYRGALGEEHPAKITGRIGAKSNETAYREYKEGLRPPTGGYIGASPVCGLPADGYVARICFRNLKITEIL